ncbi:hypothetical protein E2C01_097501 [Portunus trituberculatus]|uniref:Uncharacterized protein n=1 Tax=Portunus trituberculatus TaxID=210409 RepID=A0A5B7K4L5_PORTR|nr:hypothetical protein [Portunus trituberculatus]
MEIAGYAPLGSEQQCMAPNLKSNEATQAVGNESPWHEEAPRACEWRVIAAEHSKERSVSSFMNYFPFLSASHRSGK